MTSPRFSGTICVHRIFSLLLHSMHWYLERRIYWRFFVHKLLINKPTSRSSMIVLRAELKTSKNSDFYRNVSIFVDVFGSFSIDFYRIDGNRYISIKSDVFLSISIDRYHTQGFFHYICCEFKKRPPTQNFSKLLVWLKLSKGIMGRALDDFWRC